MGNDFILFIGISDETKIVYENALKNEGYTLLSNIDSLIFASRIEFNLDANKKIIDLIISIARKYKVDGIIIIDLTNEMNKILNDESAKNKAGWYIRRAITNAIVKKGKEN